MVVGPSVFPDLNSLVASAAEQVVTLAGAAIAARGRFAIGLSGGSTPCPLYELLASPAFASRIDWTNVHVFWGDERCVPPDHPDSNYRMARETLLDHVPLPPDNIHRLAGELDPATAAADYEAHLRAFFAGDGEAGPRFDLLLLGMGDDAHTASLFPGTAALGETERWAAANYVEKLDAWRLTLTPPALNAAAEIMVLVSGASKADAFHAVLSGPTDINRYPAQVLNPNNGRLRWLVDSEAADRVLG